MSNPDPKAVAENIIKEHLDAICQLLKPEARITFIARDPGSPQKCLAISNDDDLPELIRCIRWTKHQFYTPPSIRGDK
jgi:hypothetical protein